jgi:hypothetical protein
MGSPIAALNGCQYEHEFFISYSRMKNDEQEDRQEDHLVDQFAEALRSKLRFLLVGSPLPPHERVFLDVKNIPKGANWDLMLARAAYHSRCMVVVYTPDYDGREYCQRELTAIRQIQTLRLPANHPDFMIVPVLLRVVDDKGKHKVPVHLRPAQWSDFTSVVYPKIQLEDLQYGLKIMELINHWNRLRPYLTNPGNGAGNHICPHTILPPATLVEKETREAFPGWKAEQKEVA